VKSFVSNKGFINLFFSNLFFICFNRSGFVASSIAKVSYSFSVFVINSGKPIDESKLAATLLENDSPILVKTGRPAHKASKLPESIFKISRQIFFALFN